MLRESSPLQPSPLALARQNAEKSDGLGPLRLLFPFLSAYKKPISIGMIGVLAAGGAMLTIGWIFRTLIDRGIHPGNPKGLHQALLLMLVIVVLLAWSSYLRLVYLAGTAEQIVADLRRRILRHLLDLDLTWFEGHKTGDLLSRFTGDLAVLQLLMGTGLPIGIRNLLIVMGGLIMMVGSSPQLALLMVGLVPLIVAILFFLTPKVRLHGRAVQDRAGDVAATLNESLHAVREIQAFGLQEAQEAQFSTINAKAIGTTWHYVRLRALLSSLIILVIFCGITALLWMGGHQVMTGAISPGQLSAFVFYAVLVAGSVGALSEIYGDLQRAASALERIDDILQAKSLVTSPALPASLPQDGSGVISFDAVSFSYPTRPETLALDHFSVTLDAGGITAIVGPSGAGKTTLFNLILRFYDPNEGRILLDGIPINQLLVTNYRALFGLVPQDPTLFSTSIRENIGFADPNADEEAIRQAALAAGADRFIQNLPQGYETVLGERGTRLSGGQAQRIALARALLRDPKILLLDEATAHLDSETERLIQDALLASRKNRTTLIIAHRLSTIQHADRILVMDQGKLVASGTHQDLLHHSPLYQKLAATQFSGD